MALHHRLFDQRRDFPCSLLHDAGESYPMNISLSAFRSLISFGRNSPAEGTREFILTDQCARGVLPWTQVIFRLGPGPSYILREVGVEAFYAPRTDSRSGRPLFFRCRAGYREPLRGSRVSILSMSRNYGSPISDGKNEKAPSAKAEGFSRIDTLTVGDKVANKSCPTQEVLEG